MKQLLASVALTLCGALPVQAFDTTLYTQCLAWTPHAVGSTFLALAVQEGYPVISPIATQRQASAAYQEGSALYWEKQDADPQRQAELCAYWVEIGTAAIGWREEP